MEIDKEGRKEADHKARKHGPFMWQPHKEAIISALPSAVHPTHLTLLTNSHLLSFAHTNHFTGFDYKKVLFQLAQPPEAPPASPALPWAVTKQELQTLLTASRCCWPLHGLTFSFIRPVGGSSFHCCPLEAGGGGGAHTEIFIDCSNCCQTESLSCFCIYHQTAF